MSSPDQIVDAFYRAYNSHDAVAATALYAEDGRHEEIAMGADRQGRNALRGGLEGFFLMMPDVRWRERQRIHSAAHVAVLYEMAGTFVPQPRAGEAAKPARPVTLAGLHLFEIVEGRIAATRDYWDKAQFLQQIA